VSDSSSLDYPGRVGPRRAVISLFITNFPTNQSLITSLKRKTKSQKLENKREPKIRKNLGEKEKQFN
jgi:hypothetical protein